MKPNDPLAERWRHSSRHRAEVERSDLCGCFSCGSTFPPAAIREWISEPENRERGLSAQSQCTAICPECGIDAVLPSDAAPITPDVLSAMHARFFAQMDSGFRIGPTGPS